LPKERGGKRQSRKQIKAFFKEWVQRDKDWEVKKMKREGIRGVVEEKSRISQSQEEEGKKKKSKRR